MTDAQHYDIQDTWSASFCCLEGLVAEKLGWGVKYNPYPAGSPRARCWLYGHQTRQRKRNASRETISRPGRGGSRKGRRGEWPEKDLALLRFAGGDLAHAVIGEIVGRSHQAVANRLNRLAEEEKRS